MMATTARYAARPTPRQRWRGWSRTRKAGAVTIAVIVAAAAVAVAALLFRAPITGSATVSPNQGINWLAAETGTTSGTIECTATVVSPDELAIDMPVATPGSWCEVVGTVAAESNISSVVVQDVLYGPGVEAAFVGSICGSTIPPGSTGLAVTMRFTIPADTTPGDYPASSMAGLTAVDPSEYVDTNCPRA